MRTTGRIVLQIVVAGLGLALIGGLIGGLIAQFGTSAAFGKGAAYGMIITGVLVAFLTSQSGSPAKMAREGQWGYVGNFYGGNSALPQSPYQFVIGGFITFGLGIGLLVLTLG